MGNKVEVDLVAVARKYVYVRSLFREDDDEPEEAPDAEEESDGDQRS